MLLTNSTFIVEPLFDFVIVIEQLGLFLTDPDLDDRKLQPSMKTDTLQSLSQGDPSLKRMLSNPVRQQRGPGARRVSVQTVRNVRAFEFRSRKPAKRALLSQRHRALYKAPVLCTTRQMESTAMVTSPLL